VLIGMTGPIAAFMIVWAGGMMLLGGGKPELYSQGKTLLKNTLTGVLIILMSWLVTDFLIKSLIKGGQGDKWNEFTCPAGLSAIAPITSALPSPGSTLQLPAPVLTDPVHRGVAAVGGGVGGSVFASTFSGCGRSMPCEGKCPTRQAAFSAVSNKKLLEAIMYNESSCLINPRPSGAGAYGIMQIQPATANLYKTECNVTEMKDGQEVPMTGSITAAWLQSEQNINKIMCIADKFVDSLKDGCGTNPLNIAAGYNGGPGACIVSRDCPQLESCADGGAMRRWECPWDNRGHTIPNRGYIETRRYAPKVAACAR
jgi:hypothetical protein